MPALATVVTDYLTAVKTALQTGSDLGQNVRGAAQNYLRAQDMATVLDLLQQALTSGTLTATAGTAVSVTDASAFVANTQVGNVAVFTGNTTATLAGVEARVLSNDTNTLTFAVGALPEAPVSGDTFVVRGAMFDDFISQLREGGSLGDAPRGSVYGDVRQALGGLLLGLDVLGATVTEKYLGSLPVASGSTSSVVNVGVTLRPDELKGLHVTHLAETRTITSNTDTSITVDRPFTSAPSASPDYFGGNAAVVANAGPYDLAAGQTLVISIDGASADTATFDAAAAVLDGGTETFDLDDAQTLIISVNGGAAQTATFNTGDFVDIDAATAAEVAAVINTDITGVTADDNSGDIRITCDTLGTGSSLEVTGGTAATILGLNGASDTGTGDVVDIDAVTVAEIKTVVEADVSGSRVESSNGAAVIASATIGPTSSVHVEAGSTADTPMGLSNTEVFGPSGLTLQKPVVALPPPGKVRTHPGAQPGENAELADLINQLQVAVAAFTLPT